MKKKNKLTLKVVILIFCMLCSSLPLSSFVNAKDKPDKKPKKPKDISMSFLLSYDTQNLNFGLVNYSNIEYWLDGVMYMTNFDGLIEGSFNDKISHNLIVFFGDVVHEYIFDSSINEIIVLSTKSINSVVMWDDIDIIAGDRYGCNFDLLWLDGVNWITIVTDIDTELLTGLISIDSLIIGEYRLVETSDASETGFSFTIVQSTVIYDEIIYCIPDSTVIDVDYSYTVFGLDYPVDLTGVTYYIVLSVLGEDAWIIINDGCYVLYDTNNLTNGIITIYELATEINGETYEWKIMIDFGEVDYIESGIAVDGLTEIELTGKNLEAEFLFESQPIIGEEIDLFFMVGEEFVLVDTYITNAEGKVFISDLPIGIYKFDDQSEFSILSEDITKIVSYEIGGKSLEATFIWSSDDSPAIDTEFDLYKFNGSEFILFGSYITNGEGLIILTNMLGTGIYKFENYPEFSITIGDDLITETYSVESTLGKRTIYTIYILLGSVEYKYFSFFWFMLILFTSSCTSWIFVFWNNPLLFFKHICNCSFHFKSHKKEVIL